MKVQKIFFTFFLFTFLLSACSENMKKEAASLTELSYPSASGIEYYQDKIYLMGDDANNLLILDSGFRIIDSIALYDFAEKRIPKPVKADLEAITILNDGRLLIIGSGSLAPHRNTLWLINPQTKEKENIRIDSFFQHLNRNGIKEVNIEGVALVKDKIVLANRGNLGNPFNHFIIASNEFWKKQNDTTIHIIALDKLNDTATFNGISGICYNASSDQLLLTASTEETHSTNGDGAIGKNYLGFINNFSSKLYEKSLFTDRLLELDNQFPEIKGHKIESLSILSSTNAALNLLLAADDDNGSSHLFKIIVNKE